MKLALLIALVITCSTPSLMAQNAVVRGVVIDSSTSLPIRAATVRIDGTTRGAVTNSRGEFVIRNVTRGSAALRTTFVGYTPSLTNITILTDTTSVTLTLASVQTIYDKPEVVVSANRRVQAVQDVPITVSVITAEDLDKRSITRLDDALRYVNGIVVARDQVNIRGTSGFALGVGSRAAVLLDGFSLLSGDNGDIKFDVLPVSDIERIEVVKGAGSALYGTGALGGVIQLITKDPGDSLSVYTRAYGGLYTDRPFQQWQYSSSPSSQWGGDVRLAQRLGKVSFSVSGGVRRDESFRLYDDSFRAFGYGKLTWTPSDYTTVRLFGFISRDDKQNFVYWRSLDSATFPPATVDPGMRLQADRITGGAELTHVLSTSTSLIARYGVFGSTFQDRIGDRRLDSNYSRALAHNLDVQVTSMLTDYLVLTGGVTGRLNTVTSDVYGTSNQMILSGYVQAEYTIGSIIATIGARIDREKMDTLSDQLELSPKFGLTWEVDSDVSLRMSLGKGFRAPAIAERYAQIRYGPFIIIRNPNVLSERSWSMEVGGRWQSRSTVIPFEVDAALFGNELYDLIEPTFVLDDPAVPIKFQNITRARILGAELNLRCMLSSTLGVETGLTLMSPTDLTTQSRLKYRNTALSYSRVSWTALPWLETQLEYRYQDRISAIDDRLALFVPDADARVSTHIVDARVFVNATERIRVGLLGRNLMNYAYTEIVGNLGPTRSFILQFEYR